MAERVLITGGAGFIGGHVAAAMPAAMRAVVITTPRRCKVREAPTPVPAAGQVSIRVEGRGVCGSNLPLWEGRDGFRYPAPPGNPGHEGWGRIAALGPGARGGSVGDRVYLCRRAP